MASPVRKPGNADRDKYRHPIETLEFFGIKPTMTVLEVGPGEGWYTELLAPTLAARGKLIDTINDPNGPDDSRATLNGQAFKAFLDKAPELFGKVQTVVVDGKAPKLDAAGPVDAVLLMREVHGMVAQGTLDAWLGEIHKALKAGGVLGIEEHRAANGDVDPVETAKKGYVAEKWLIEHVEADGFKLAGKSEEVNANPKGHERLLRGGVDAAAVAAPGRQGPGQVRRDRRERPHDAQVREGAVNVAGPGAPWASLRPSASLRAPPRQYGGTRRDGGERGRCPPLAPHPGRQHRARRLRGRRYSPAT